MAPFLDSLRVELAGRGFACCSLVDPTSTSIGPEALRVSVDFVPCASESTAVRIAVTDAQEPQASEREVSLADVAASARSRALALVVAELIRSFGQTPPKDPPKEVPEIPVKDVAPIAEMPPSARLSLGLEGRARTVPTRNTTLWGGRARLMLLWKRMHAEVDVGGDTASARTDLGTVSLRSVSLGLGAGPHFATHTVSLDVGPRFELGRAWIRGDAQSSDATAGSGGGVFSTLGLRASLEIPAAARLRPGLAVEAGGVLRGTRGESDGRTVVGITGYYLIGAVAIAFSL
jgi:hypothetical protein